MGAFDNQTSFLGYEQNVCVGLDRHTKTNTSSVSENEWKYKQFRKVCVSKNQQDSVETKS